MGTLTTPVQAWPYPAETDAPDVAADLHALALALDVVAKRLSGLASARPAAASTPVDTIYYATDTGVYSICTGAAWGTMLVAGAWSTPTLTNATATGSPWAVPQLRTVGDKVELRGALTVTSSGLVSFTGPAPASQCGLAFQEETSAIVDLGQVTTSGVIRVSATAGHNIVLDGLSYPLL